MWCEWDGRPCVWDPFCSDATISEAENNVGVDQIHVTQEFAELMHCICQEFTGADTNPGGRAPGRGPRAAPATHLYTTINPKPKTLTQTLNPKY